MSNTGSKREKRTDVGKNNPPKDKRFSSTNQPTGKAKSAGKIKAQFSRNIIKAMLNLPYKFAPDSRLKTQIAEAFGPGVLDMTVGEVMTLQQMQKAILKGDSSAYNSLIDQGLGRQVQTIAEVDPDGNALKPVKLVFPKGMKFELPSNTDGEE